MQNTDTVFAKEGHPYILITLALFVLTLPLGIWWLTLPLFLAAAFSLWFFRNPEREVPDQPGIYISPADGKVVDVGMVTEERYIFRDMQEVSIFMSPLNVHVNRVPRTGVVKEVIYNPGKYFAADTDKASLNNEQAAIIVEDRAGRLYMFVQIAGFIARRIVCYARAGKEIQIGQRVGLIRFGSRLDVYMPPQTLIAVSLGQKVRAGETIIGRLE